MGAATRRGSPSIRRRLASLVAAVALAATPAVHAAGVRLPEVTPIQLDSGVRVLLLPDPEVPLITLHARILGGSAEDPVGREGTASLLARLLKRGTYSLDAEAFQEAVEFEGGTFETSASTRWIEIDADFPSKAADRALDLLTDVLLNPSLLRRELRRERGRAIDEVRASREQPSTVIRSYAQAWLLGDHPWARPSSGDETTLPRVRLGDVRNLARRQVVGSRTWLAIAGDFDPEAMKARVTETLGSWRDVGEAPASVQPPSRRDEARVLLVDKPGSLQTYFRFGDVGAHWSHPDYPIRMLANTILGGRFTSRLNTALRVKSGLTYGAWSFFVDALGGPFWVSTYTATKTSRQAIEMARDVVKTFLDEGITADELASARAYIQGQYAPDHVETSAQVADMLLDLAMDGLGNETIDTLFDRLDGLTVDEVNAALPQLFPADRHSWVLIGQADKLRELAAELGAVTETSLAQPSFTPAGR